MKQHKTIIPDRKKSETLEFRSVLAESNPESEVRRRAYELYEKRGRLHGHAMDDWLQAERELRKARAVA